FDNDYLMGTVEAGPSDGWGLNLRSDTALQPTQWGDGASFSQLNSTKTIGNNNDFILIVSHDHDTNTSRIWGNDYAVVEEAQTYVTATNEADGNFSIGGLSNFAMYVGRMYGFMGLPEFCDNAKARSIIDYYEALHSRPYTRLNALFTGQSNHENLFTQGSGAGIAQFETTAATHYPLGATTINGALGGAAVHYDAITSYGAFLNATNDGKGTVYTDTLEAAVTASGISNINIDWVSVMIGETDALSIDDETITEAEHKAAMNTFIDLLEADFPNSKILLVPLMVSLNSNASDGWGAARRAQFEIVNERSNVYEAPAMYDLPNSDNLHLTDAGYETMGERLANVMAAYDGLTTLTGRLGPRVVSAEFDTDTDYLDITIEHDGGTDFGTPLEYIGHYANINDTVIFNDLTAPIRVSSTVYRVNFAADTFDDDDEVTVYWPWATLKTRDSAKVLIDNATDPLPLRPTFDTITAQKKTFDIVSENLVLYGDPTSEENYIVSGTDISEVKDLSNGANTLEPIDAALPDISTLNSVGVILFTTSGLEAPTNVFEDGANEMFFVADPSSGSTQVLFDTVHSSGTKRFHIDFASFFAGMTFIETITVYYDDGSSAFSGAHSQIASASSQQYVCHLRIKSDGDFEMSLNGGDYETLFSAGGAFSAPDGVFTLGRRLSTSVNGYNGRLGKLAIYTGNMNQGEADTVIAKFADDYGISI
ncbi:sialate O-acetylesterase, partial [Alphaproteobacteria bacterium]|nr:sialate O-acetylesterase [Alphaproteobacteria bacterium]